MIFQQYYLILTHVFWTKMFFFMVYCAIIHDIVFQMTCSSSGSIYLDLLKYLMFDFKNLSKPPANIVKFNN